MLPDNFDVFMAKEQAKEALEADQEFRLYELFKAGHFNADFIVTALKNIGTKEDFDSAERADSAAFDVMVDMECDENQILTHFLIFSEDFREDVFASIKEEYTRYMQERGWL